MSKLNSISFLATKFSKLQFGLIKLIGVLAITSSVSFASADQDSNLLQIIDGYVFGTNATVSVVADDELNKDVVELQILESGNFEQAYVGFPLNQEDFSTASAFEFKVLDQQGSNTVYITLVDSAGDKWSGWSSDQDKTVLNAWTNIEFDYTSAVSSIDLTQVSEVRFALWNAGTYRFSDVALLSSSDVIDTVNVTFQVDMSAVETNAEGVYLAGGGFGQDGYLMTDNGSDVWSVTVDVNANSTTLYKFRNQPSYGTWDGFEDQAGLVIGGCATGQHNDRFVDVAEADITLPVVAYGSCTAEPYVPDATVTLEPGDAIDFESTIAIESFGGTEGSIVNGVLNVVKNQDAADWAGNVVARGGYIFPLTATDTLVTADVYSTVSATIRMKLELEADAAQSAEVDSTVAHTGSGWETLTFNFAGTNAIDANFDTLVLFPNYGVAGAGNTYQYDNVTFVGGADTSGGTAPTFGPNEVSITEAFGGTTISEDGTSFTYPAGAEGWGGFANMNADIYPLRFTSDGSISFMGSVADGGSANVRFRLEYNPHPNVDPAYDAVGVTVSGATPTQYTVNVPSQGDNTFSSLIMYIAENDVAVTVTDILVDGEIAVTDVVGPETITVTFQVDMTAVETHEEGVYLAGGDVGQDGVLMTDNGNDVWTATYEVAVNTQLLYKFRNQPSFGIWDGFEDALTLADGGCATGQYNDRFVGVAEVDIVLPVVAYGSCTDEPYVSGAPAVSFTVTASDAAEVKFHSSGFNWQEASQVVAVANGDGTWTATVDPGFANGVEYKWIIDGVEEDLSTAYRNAECANDNVAGYDDTWFNRTWAADSGDVTGDIAGACSGTGPSGSWDFDNDGNADALTDGLLLLRYTFGLTGVSLTDSAIASGSPLTPAEVEANVATATTSFADIDGSGNVDALTDGLMLLRYLFGLTGASLIDSAVAAGAERTTAADIEAYIQSLIP
jgi:hypothetical protein